MLGASTFRSTLHLASRTPRLSHRDGAQDRQGHEDEARRDLLLDWADSSVSLRPVQIRPSPVEDDDNMCIGRCSAWIRFQIAHGASDAA